MKDDERILTPTQKGQLPVRVPRTEGDRLAWATAYMKPAPLQKKVPKEEGAIPIDKLLLQRLQTKSPQPGRIWEADLSFAPMPVREGKGRPFFPHIALFAEHNSGYVLGTSLLTHAAPISGFRDSFCKLLEKSDSLPQQVQVSKKEVQETLAPILAELGIKVQVVKVLRAIERARVALFDRFSQ